MRYSISNAIPHNPKSEKHPYENLVNSGFSEVWELSEYFDLPEPFIRKAVTFYNEQARV